MTDERGVTHYQQMPIPPVEAHTKYFEAGVVTLGVEYRLLDDAIAAASAKETAKGNAGGANQLDDRGVSLHVFGAHGEGSREYLRFDCFEEDPHYHYVDWRAQTNQMVHIDSDAEGDALAWAIDRIRKRLPQMLERAGASSLARSFDPALVEAILPAVEAEAQRARLDHDEEAIRSAALGSDQ